MLTFLCSKSLWAAYPCLPHLNAMLERYSRVSLSASNRSQRGKDIQMELAQMAMRVHRGEKLDKDQILNLRIEMGLFFKEHGLKTLWKDDSYEYEILAESEGPLGNWIKAHQKIIPDFKLKLFLRPSFNESFEKASQEGFRLIGHSDFRIYPTEIFTVLEGVDGHHFLRLISEDELIFLSADIGLLSRLQNQHTSTIIPWSFFETQSSNTGSMQTVARTLLYPELARKYLAILEESSALLTWEQRKNCRQAIHVARNYFKAFHDEWIVLLNTLVSLKDDLAKDLQKIDVQFEIPPPSARGMHFEIAFYKDSIETDRIGIRSLPGSRIYLDFIEQDKTKKLNIRYETNTNPRKTLEFEIQEKVFVSAIAKIVYLVGESWKGNPIPVTSLKAELLKVINDQILPRIHGAIQVDRDHMPRIAKIDTDLESLLFSMKSEIFKPLEVYDPLQVLNLTRKIEFDLQELMTAFEFITATPSF